MSLRKTKSLWQDFLMTYFSQNLEKKMISLRILPPSQVDLESDSSFASYSGLTDIMGVSDHTPIHLMEVQVTQISCHKLLSRHHTWIMLLVKNNSTRRLCHEAIPPPCAEKRNGHCRMQGYKGSAVLWCCWGTVAHAVPKMRALIC